MKLRSGKEYFYDCPLFEVKIDFDHASKMWLQNKIKIENGCYRYRTNFLSKINVYLFILL